MRIGIYKPEQWRGRSFLARLYASLASNRISYSLLRVSREPSAQEITRFEAIAGGLNIGGVMRTTSVDRFREVDPWLVEILLERFSRDSDLAAHEWAASDCRAAASFAFRVFAEFPNATVIASDLVLFLTEHHTPEGEVFIFDSEGVPLQYIRPPLVVRLHPPERVLFPVNWLFGRYAQRKIRRMNCFAGLPHSEISLVHPDALALAKADRRFAIQPHSVFEPLSEPVNLIRALNILNPVYFAERRLMTGVDAAWSSLREGGIFVTGRTTDTGEQRICVLLKTSSGFERIARYGPAPEIEGLALKYRSGA